MTDASSALEILRWASIALYVAVAIGAVFWAYRRPSPVRTRTTGVVAALVLLGLFPGSYALRAMEQQRSRAEFEKYREAAWAHFEKRCKEDAGEKIYRIVDGVEGIFLGKPRKRPTQAQLRDQFWADDLYGLVSYPPVEISRYLAYLNSKDMSTTKVTSRRGYRYVEVSDRDGTGVLRYKLDNTNDRLLIEASNRRLSRYVITREDISTRDDRKYWIAGGRLTVIDPSTNEVLGERVGFVFDQAFGSTAGARSPWLFAQHHACPTIRANVPIDRLFVQKVLKPLRDERHGK